MADGEYRRLAPVCGVAGCDGGPKIIKGLCTRHYQQVRHHGQAGPREQQCKHCGAAFTAERQRMYCTKKCSTDAHARRSGVRPLEEFKASVRNPAHYFKCEWCSKDAHRPFGGNTIKKGCKNRWCSMACKKEQAATLRMESERLESVRRSRHGAGKALAAAICRLAMLRLKAELGAPRLACSLGCAVCGKRFEFVHKQGRVPLYCSDRCSTWSPSGRRSKAKTRKAGKMLRRGVTVERFHEFEVFDRDGWRCQICGVSTPRSRRGTRHANAPELDHVVPVSAGGEHSRANTQCACRRCNAAKGAGRPVGQLGLFRSAAASSGLLLP